MEADGKVGEEVCVTGASGFIGSTLVRLLLRRGYTVRGTVQNLQNEKETRHLEALEGADSSLRLYQIDLLDYDSIFSAINGVVGVFHLASPCTVDQVTDPQRELLEPAIQGTLNVLKAAKASGVKRVVVTSSISAIVPSPGWPADVVKGEDCWTDVEYCKQNGLWYSASKTLAEKEAWRFAEETGLNVVVVNPGTVLGPILPPAINASMGVLLGLLQEWVGLGSRPGPELHSWKEARREGPSPSPFPILLRCPPGGLPCQRREEEVVVGVVVEVAGPAAAAAEVATAAAKVATAAAWVSSSLALSDCFFLLPPTQPLPPSSTPLAA
ncbi:Aldehyde reductase 2 [Nymphaea thermarum]|nr:Aldehyde reductase 2 [Nymphaea thermarum]